MTGTTHHPVTRLFDASFARFLIAGGANTALGFVLFRAFLDLYGPRAGGVALAQATAYAIGIALSYTINQRWTFRSDSMHRRALPRFVTAHLGALGASSLLLQAGVSRLHLPVTLCWVLVTGMITVANFVVQRVWVFRVRTPPRMPLAS